MKLQPLPLAIVFSARTPSLAISQNPQVTNCHTPESAGNFVGSDETIVNGFEIYDARILWSRLR